MQRNDITIILVAYNPVVKLLKKIIERFHLEYPIIVTNNSEKKLDKKFYNYKNVHIIDSKKNNGNGAGINQCLNNCKTKLALYLDIDSKIDKDNINKLLNYSRKIKSFGALVPNNNKSSLKNEKKTGKKIFKRWNVEGSVILFNLDILKNQISFDEKIFLYFEETDFFFNCIKKNINVFFIENVNIEHQGASSIAYENSTQLEKLKAFREWHYMWSSFYFYKKNFGFFFSLKKNFPLFIKDILKLLFYLINFNIKSSTVRFSRIMGFLNSLINLKSKKRFFLYKSYRDNTNLKL